MSDLLVVKIARSAIGTYVVSVQGIENFLVCKKAQKCLKVSSIAYKSLHIPLSIREWLSLEASFLVI